MQDYHQLEIWNRSMDCAVAIYGFTTSLPADEKYNLASQLRIAATSVPLLWRRFTKPGRQPRDPKTARLLLSRGAAHDLTIASALGDFDRVKEILDKDPARIRDIRPNGRRPLTAAVEFQHDNIVRLLLERGTDPNWREFDAERGAALHTAARDGSRQMVELLLAHGADPNAGVESSGNALFIAKTPELRELLRQHGGTLSTYDLVWKKEDDEVVRLVTEDPKLADLGCGGIFTAVVTLGKRDLLKRLLDLGIRVPRVVTGCQTFSWNIRTCCRLCWTAACIPILTTGKSRQCCTGFADPTPTARRWR